MKTSSLLAALSVLFSIFSVSCQKEGQEDEVLAPNNEPSRQRAVAALTVFAKSLEEGDFTSSADLMATPPGMSQEEKVEAMKSMIEKREISSAGVAVLAEKGTWGKLREVFAERGLAWAERWKLEPGNCWALGYEGAETAFIWNGESFLIFRCDDVGKLVEAAE
ncbi:hypothetical protein AAFN60_03450 [Roseibacillus persicicus]|uniref:hypothetical protein n=1 Tax=Roseibacillus persicicus TaxID=454148 RepID=UPI00398B5472